MTRLRHGNPPRREPDAARAARDPREPRGHKSLDVLMQLAAIYERQALETQKKIESGEKVYSFELGWLNYWKRLKVEISELEGL